MKNTKRALLASLMSIILCLSMLIGSTFAWFTDTATTGVNTIVSGNLDVGLKYQIDNMNGTWADAENATEIFQGIFWEPGFTKVVYFQVENKGSLALEYEVVSQIESEKEGTNVTGEKFKLSDHIQFGIVETDVAFENAAAARAAIKTPVTLGNISAGKGNAVAADKTSTFAVVAWMPEDVGNVANHNGNAPEIKFAIKVLATQYNSESDSFGNTYDENAEYPEAPKLDNIVAAPGTVEELSNVLTEALTGGATDGVITVNIEKDFDANYQWKMPTGANYSGVNKVVINGNGHKISKLNAPLLEGVFGGYEGSLEINDLIIADADITGSGWGVGAFLGSADSTNEVIFNNCDLIESQVHSTSGTAVGGLIGATSANTVKLIGCDVKSSTIEGVEGAVGALIGLCQSNLVVTGGEITGNTLKSGDNGAWRVGLIGGTLNGATSTVNVSDVTENSNTLTQEAAASNNIVDNKDSKITKWYGRVYKTITINGTEYSANQQ